MDILSTAQFSTPYSLLLRALSMDQPCSRYGERERIVGMIPRLVALYAIGGAVFIALPSAYSMNVMERTVATQTQSIRSDATGFQRKRKAAEADPPAYLTKQPHMVRHSVQPYTQAGQDRHNNLDE
ncbi:MAG: hypothetical protein P4L99_20925 [Chthoniobacter sp.]|nr:hypothetical protein [Chthoniobacter sp.]